MTAFLKKIRARIWRVFLYWKFQILQKESLKRPVLERIAGRPFLILPEVFNPRLFRSGEFMAEILNSGNVPEGSEVLDLGTGSGVGAVAAASWAGRIVAVDVNPVAVRCARINALLNCVEHRIEVLEGDLFAPVLGRQFDVVLFNPPYFEGRPQDRWEGSFRADDIPHRFASNLGKYLKPGGYGLLVLSSAGAEETFLRALRESGFAVEVTAEQNLVSEVLRLYRVWALN